MKEWEGRERGKVGQCGRDGKDSRETDCALRGWRSKRTGTEPQVLAMKPELIVGTKVKVALREQPRAPPTCISDNCV
jgi:hypothetical protein